MSEDPSGAAQAAQVAKAAGDHALKISKRMAGKVREAANADGADTSGLAALLATHALSSAGDALVAVSLASTTFFTVSADAARGKIALYLILTLLPFALLIPVAGPVLDRFPHGRRNVIAITAAGRGLTAWVLAGYLASLGLYPAAVAILALQRAYTVVRSAAVIRVRPPELGLVAANGRMNMASLASSGVAAAVGFMISKSIGTQWVLRLAALVFLTAAATSLKLPSRIDDARAVDTEVRLPFELAKAPDVVRRPLVSAVALRSLVGLLTLGLAILLKANGSSVVSAGLILGAGVVGGIVGTGIASRLAPRTVERITAWALVAPMAAGLLATIFGGVTFNALAVGSVGLGASLAKYALDASLQTHVDPRQTNSAFARSETSLQLGWAVGGGLGLVLSLLDGTPLGFHGALRMMFLVVTVLPIAGLFVSRRWLSASGASSSRPSSAA